jgi:hypothetical protein
MQNFMPSFFMTMSSNFIDKSAGNARQVHPNLGWIDGRADDCDRMGAPLPDTAVADVAG